jgi:hypothetical protein
VNAFTVGANFWRFVAVATPRKTAAHRGIPL